MVGARLRELRKNRGLTQGELAEIFGLKDNTISQYENDINEPSDEIKIMMAKYFNVSVDYLIGFTDLRSTYDSDNFVELPEGLSADEVDLVKDFIGLVQYRQNKAENL